MSGPRYKGFIGQAYESQSLVASCATLWNWYLEIMEEEAAVSPAVFYPTPGVEQFASVAQVGGAAIFATASGGTARVFAVIGFRLYEIFANGTTSERGAVAQDQNPATICTNGDGGNQLFITAGGNGYCYDLNTDTLSQVAALNGIATMGGFLDGFFLAFDRSTSTVYLSDVYDGTAWDPANFFQRSSRSDSWQAMWVTSQGQIFLPGAKTRDYWFNSGDSPIPFAPTTAGTQPDGIAATFSISENSSTLVWLQTNEDGGYVVMAANGYRGSRISTHAVEDDIASYARVDDAVGETYTARGHRFYLLTFPSANVTWCVDLTNGQWHKRSTRNASSGARDAWRPRFHAFAFNLHLWVDSQSGKVWNADETFPMDVDGLTIDRERTAPAICASHDRLTFGTLEVVMQTGIGNQNDPGANPMITFAMSNDFGQTWGSERAVNAGRIGQTFTRVKLERNGSSRARAVRMRVSDPVYPWAIVDAFWDIRRPQGRAMAA